MNTFLPYVSDEHLLQCVGNLHAAYERAKAGINKSKFYANKIDTVKLTFDVHFNGQTQEQVLKNELIRQVDKSINNAIGTFHEQILSGIQGFKGGHNTGYDIKATDNTLFADIKNKFNTMNSSASESLFQKLKALADTHKAATCYWVQIWAKSSFCERWIADINGKEYNHSRVYKISGDQFYALLTGIPDSLFQLYRVLPEAIETYLAQNIRDSSKEKATALDEIRTLAGLNSRSLLDQIMADNYGYYQGFEEL